MEEFSDEDLLARIRMRGGSSKGDPLVNQLFQRHQARVAAWCWRMTGNVDSAADLAQEVFLKAFQRLDSFRGESKFTTWLYTIARNQCLDALKSRSARPEESAETVLDEIADQRAEAVSSAMERRESEDLVRKLMRESLDDTEVQVMTMHYVHEMPLASVTRVLGLSNQSGAKAYIVSARRKLARALEQRKSGEQLKGGGYAR